MRLNDSMKSGHFFRGFRVNQAAPLLLLVIIAGAMKLFTYLPIELTKYIGFNVEDEDEKISVDEDLPNFWETIKLK